MIRWVLFSAAAVFAYGPLMWEHGQHLWSREYFQFFPIYLIAVGVVLRERLTHAELPVRGTWRVEPISLGLAIPLLGIAYWVWSPWIAAVSLVLLGDSLLCPCYQARRTWRLLTLLIPLPLGLDAVLVHKLQLLSSVQASRVLDFLRIPHVMQGNVLELSSKRLFVEEACSGINSVYMLTAATLFCLVISRDRLIRGLPLLVSVAWWALLANVFRIVLIAVAHQNYQLDLSAGWRHESLGLASTVFALAGIFSTKSLLDFLTASIADQRSLDSHTSKTLSPIVLWDMVTTHRRSLVYGLERVSFTVAVSAGRLLPGLAAILILMGTGHWGMVTILAMKSTGVASDLAPNTGVPNSQQERFETLAEVTFDGLPGFQADEFAERDAALPAVSVSDGGLSKTWRFRAPAVTGIVTVTGPFRDWQTLVLSGRSPEWKVEDKITQPLIGRRTQDRLIAIQLVNSSGQRSNHYVCAFYPSGELASPPLSVSAREVTARIQGRLNDFAVTADSTVLWKVQLTTLQETGLSMDSERHAERQLFAQIVAVLENHWKLR